METSTSEAKIDALADRTLGTVDRAAQTAHQAIDRVAAKVGPAVEKLRGTTTSAAEALRAKADALGDFEDRWVESARGYVRENPFTAVAVAVLAGVLLGKLASSR